MSATTIHASDDVFSVAVWSVLPGADEFPGGEREHHITVSAPTPEIAVAAGWVAVDYATVAQVDQEGTTFLRSGRRDPYEDCDNPAAARARDRFLGSRTCEIMQDEGIGAVAAYRRAAAELEGESEVRHTPGPWMVVDADRGYVITALDGCYDVAVVRNIGNQDNQANANLIAAAPELLKAAESALHYMRLHKYADQAWADDLAAAIKKVRGG